MGIDGRLGKVETEVKELKEDIKELKKEDKQLKNAIQELKETIILLNNNLGNVTKIAKALLGLAGSVCVAVISAVILEVLKLIGG